MKIFILRPNYDEYEYMVLKKETQWEIKKKFNGQIIEDWIPLKVVMEKKKKNRKKGDFPAFATHIPVFSHNAIDSMKELLEPHGQILPLDCKSGDYFSFNVTSTVDCLNEDKSEIVRFPNGRIMDITKYVLKKNTDIDKLIFKLEGVELSDVFVNEHFVNRVTSSKLNGFDFTQVEID